MAGPEPSLATPTENPMTIYLRPTGPKYRISFAPCYVGLTPLDQAPRVMDEMRRPHHAMASSTTLDPMPRNKPLRQDAPCS